MDNINVKILQTNDLLALCYELQTKTFSHLEYEKIKNLFEQNGFQNVLDIGTGEGTFISGLAQIMPQVFFEAIDASKELIDSAILKNTKPNIKYKHRIFSSAFDFGLYDLVHTRFAVEHMPDIDGFIQNAYKVIKPGGMLFITEYYIDDLHSTNEIWSLFREKEFEFYNKFQSHPRISVSLPKLLYQNGFKERLLYLSIVVMVARL